MKSHSKIILFDTETTGLLLPEGAPLKNQPQIIEFAAIAVDENFNELDRLEFFANPLAPLPGIIKKITGITDDLLKDKEPFPNHIGKIFKFWKDVDIIISHNVNYDMGMLRNELNRIHHPESDFTALEWLDEPSQYICTVEATFHIKNRRLKLEQAYKHFTGKDALNKHRAMGDVETLLELTKELVKEGIICLSTSKSEQSIPSEDALGQ